MKYRKLSTSGDYQFGHNGQDFVSDTDAVAQAISTRLKLLLGEWWEDLTDGLPLFQSILGQRGTPDNIKGADLLIRERILGTPNVTGVVDLKSTYASTTRSYSISGTVNTAFGTTPVQEAL